MCAGCVAASGFFLGARSLEELKPVDIGLQAVTHCAIAHTPVDFTVYHGFRTDAEQRGFIAAGVTWVLRSKHQDGLAIDIMAIDPATGKGSWAKQLYYRIAPAFYACGEHLGYPITWGGEWTKQDLVHFERKQRR